MPEGGRLAAICTFSHRILSFLTNDSSTIARFFEGTAFYHRKHPASTICFEGRVALKEKDESGFSPLQPAKAVK